jgi:DNA repair protein RadC
MNMQNKFIREVRTVYGKKTEVDTVLDKPALVAMTAGNLLGWQAQENVIVFYVNNKNAITGYTIASKGSLTEGVLEPSMIFRNAILTASSSIILYHNHPSGKLESSQADIAATKRMVKAGEILGIAVLDHVIGNLEDGSYYSLRENNEM